MFWNKKEKPMEPYRTPADMELPAKKSVAQELKEITISAQNNNDSILQSKAKEIFNEVYSKILLDAQANANKGINELYFSLPKELQGNRYLTSDLSDQLKRDGFKDIYITDTLKIICFKW